jgi:hypothetical protein
MSARRRKSVIPCFDTISTATYRTCHDVDSGVTSQLPGSVHYQLPVRARRRNYAEGGREVLVHCEVLAVRKGYMEKGRHPYPEDNLP